MTWPGRRSAVLAVVLVTLGIAGLAHLHFVFVQYRLQTIAPAKLYQSAAMPPNDLLALARQLNLRTVIDLRRGDDEKEGEAIAAEREALAAAGLRWVHLPCRQVPEPATCEAFLAQMRRPDAWPVLVHCQHGTGRSVLLSAIYRIEIEGWSPEDARRATRWATWGSSFDAQSRKGRFLLDYPPVRR